MLLSGGGLLLGFENFRVEGIWSRGLVRAALGFVVSES